MQIIVGELNQEGLGHAPPEKFGVSEAPEEHFIKVVRSIKIQDFVIHFITVYNFMPQF
jgi:hypothetical protein